jgi:hypothetical protein
MIGANAETVYELREARHDVAVAMLSASSAGPNRSDMPCNRD